MTRNDIVIMAARIFVSVRTETYGKLVFLVRLLAFQTIARTIIHFLCEYVFDLSPRS